MREIKFRAWDKEEKTMVKNFAHVGKKGNIHLAHGLFGEYIPMQYTGLKDKNGVEIYEGDLLEYPEDKMNLFDEGVYRVGFEDGEFVIVEIFNEKNNLSLSGAITEKHNPGYAPKNIEVIGNIYENQELLEEYK